MKKFTSVLLLSILLSLTIIFQACKKDSNPTAPPDDNQVKIPETTKPVDSTDYKTNLVGISNDSTTFTFNSGFTAKHNLAVNDVLVIASGEGLLRKITDIDSSENGVVVTTTQATLEEAIENGDISLNQNLQESEIKKVDYYYEGITYKINKGQNSNFDFNMDILLFDLDNNHNTTNDQVRLTGSFTLDAHLIFSAKISSFKLRNIKIGLEATNSESLELKAKLDYTIQKEITLATIHFSPIYLQLGPIPVVIVNKLDIKAGGSGYANASLTVGVDNSVSYEAGINYVRGQGWNPYSNFTNHFNYTPPVLTANAGARIYVKPEVSVGVYGVLAGYADAEAYGEILVDLVNDPWWQLYAGLNFGVGARAKIWSIELFDFHKNVLELRWLLAKAKGVTAPGCPGIPTVTDSRNGKVYHTVLIGSQCWLRENMDIGTRINGSKSQTNNSTIEKYCYNDNPANCNTYGGLYQWDEAMQYTNIEGAKGICPTGWHIPTMTDILALAYNALGSGNALKSVSQGTGQGVGTNTTGFSALLSGDIYDNSTFENLGQEVYFWLSREFDDQSAGNLNLNSADSLIYFGENDYKKYGFSVRCVKD